MVARRRQIQLRKVLTFKSIANWIDTMFYLVKSDYVVIVDLLIKDLQ